MEFRTQIPIPPQEPKLDHGSRVLLLGSCFVENIGKKLEYYKFQTLQNPFGILFHPAAIASFLEDVLQEKVFSEADVFQHNERWHSFSAHSALSRNQREELLYELNAAVEKTNAFLKGATHVILTPGTAWGYKLKASGKTVANCHKVPQREFEKQLLEVDAELERCVRIIRQLNPEACIIFTVSPVRHLKDGFVENQQSKARLISAVHKAVSGEENTRYFPSYEIMMDELRDYRFYAQDMVHPSQVAIDYIWQRFSETYTTAETRKLMEEVEQIKRGLAHRPFNEDSEAHRKFLAKLQLKMAALLEKYPSIRF